MYVNEMWHGGIRALIDWDNTIFNNMVLPNGVNPEDVIDRILYKYGDSPLFTPNPEVIKFYIGRWSVRRLPLWERYKKVIEAEYDPLWNYDRTETRTIEYGKRTDYEGTIDRDITGEIENTNDETVKNDISADNSEIYQPDRQDVIDGTQKTRYNDYNEKNTLDHSDINSGEDVESIRAFGNIGVMSSQALAAAEMDLIPRLDIVEYIADDWHSEFNLFMYV